MLNNSTENNKFVTYEYKKEKEKKIKIFEEKMKSQQKLKTHTGLSPKFSSKELDKFNKLDQQGQKSLNGLRVFVNSVKKTENKN